MSSAGSRKQMKRGNAGGENAGVANMNKSKNWNMNMWNNLSAEDSNWASRKLLFGHAPPRSGTTSWRTQPHLCLLSVIPSFVLFSLISLMCWSHPIARGTPPSPLLWFQTVSKCFFNLSFSLEIQPQRRFFLVCFIFKRKKKKKNHSWIQYILNKVQKQTSLKKPFIDVLLSDKKRMASARGRRRGRSRGNKKIIRISGKSPWLQGAYLASHKHVILATFLVESFQPLMTAVFRERCSKINQEEWRHPHLSGRSQQRNNRGL